MVSERPATTTSTLDGSTPGSSTTTVALTQSRGEPRHLPHVGEKLLDLAGEIVDVAFAPGHLALRTRNDLR
jgi:hypothetical protein